MKSIPTSLFHQILLPENSKATTHPALIMVHGRGADEEDLLGLSPALDDRLLILSVRAPFRFPDSGGYTWYDVGNIGTPEPGMFRESYEKLLTFVHDALKHYPIDPVQVYLLGFSMGTVMCYALALTRPRLFRGVVANSGYLPLDTHLTLLWNELAGLEFFISHGTQDPVIPVAFARRSKDLFEQAKARYTYREYAMGHQISEESLAEAAAWLRNILDSKP